MTGREAIELYLKAHPTFTNEQVGSAYNINFRSVAYAASRMVHEGKLVVHGQDNKWAVYRYRQPGDDEPINTIFGECRASGAMQRVLCVYGVVPPEKVFRSVEGRALRQSSISA